MWILSDREAVIFLALAAVMVALAVIVARPL
jgi:hypothetical protein